MTVTNDGPTEANIDDQITFIDNYITQGVSGVLFAVNDPGSPSPRYSRRPLEAGIHVVGYDANSHRMPGSGSSTRPSSTASARR